MKRILLISALAWSVAGVGQTAWKNALKFGNDIQITSSGRIIIR